MEEIFKKYYEFFDTSIKEITIKYDHSLRVMNLCENIAISMQLCPEDVLIAKEIGLLHDYARFEQWTKYKTYNDNNSFDHGDEASILLFDKGEIEKFNINKDHYKYINKAVKYHNKYKIEESSCNKTNLFCKIIRDADKLDILNIFVRNIHDNFSKEGIVEVNVDKQFMNHKLILLNRKMSGYEAHLCRLAFIYDMNFKYSIDYIKDNNIVSRYEKMINNKMLSKYFKELNNYVNNIYFEEDKYVRKEI